MIISSRSTLTSGQPGRLLTLKSGLLKSFSAGKLMSSLSPLTLLRAKHSRIERQAEVSKYSVPSCSSARSRCTPTNCRFSKRTSHSNGRKVPKTLAEPSTTARFGKKQQCLRANPDIRGEFDESYGVDHWAKSKQVDDCYEPNIRNLDYLKMWDVDVTEEGIQLVECQGSMGKSSAPLSASHLSAGIGAREPTLSLRAPTSQGQGIRGKSTVLAYQQGVFCPK